MATFKWATLLLATAAAAVLLLMLNDLRIQLKTTARTVNEKLPQILDKTQKSTETLAELSEDLRQLRDLAGVADNGRDKTLVAYADQILDRIEASNATIGLKPTLSRESLKDPQPAREWATAARKEALWLTFRCKSKEELLQRLCENKFGSAWHIQIDQQKPLPLSEWIATP